MKHGGSASASLSLILTAPQRSALHLHGRRLLRLDWLRRWDRARVDAIDERPERSLLARVIVSPERGEVVVLVDGAPEVLEAPLRVPERIADEIEEEVAGRGIGQEREARVGVRREDLVDRLAGVAPQELEPGLALEFREARGVEPGGLGRVHEPGQGRDPGRLELHHLAPPDAGDAAEAVGRIPPGVAERQEVTDPAGVAGVGSGLAAVLDEGLQPSVERRA